MNNKQKKFLRKEAHHLNPVANIGKNGLSEEFMVQIDEVLEKRELIKVHLLQNTDEETTEASAEIAEAVDAFVVQTIGRVITLYRPSQEAKYQEISAQVKALG